MPQTLESSSAKVCIHRLGIGAKDLAVTRATRPSSAQTNTHIKGGLAARCRIYFSAIDCNLNFCIALRTLKIQPPLLGIKFGTASARTIKLELAVAADGLVPIQTAIVGAAYEKIHRAFNRALDRKAIVPNFQFRAGCLRICP